MKPNYREEVSKYQKKDALITILFWIALMLLYVVAGLVGNVFGVPLLTVVNVVMVVICVVILLKNGQGPSSVGFRRKNIWQSLGLALLISAFVLTVNIVMYITVGFGTWEPSLGMMVSDLLYWIFVIALFEEFIYRGYIQTRLYGIFKNDVSAVLIGALLFSLSHVPFQVASGRREFDLSLVLWLVFTFLAHFLLNYVYRRYNSIYGAILLHAMLNWMTSPFNGLGLPEWAYYMSNYILGFVLIIWSIRALYFNRRALKK